MSRRSTTYDTVILGGGSMGLSAACDLSARGQKVLVLDRYESPHVFGSHHGSTRLIRIAYAEGASYVPLGRRARQLWLELEQSDLEHNRKSEVERLFAQIGVVSILHPSASSISEIESCVEQFQLPFERLTPQSAMRKWPGLLIPEDYVVHFDQLGGVLFSEACLRAYKRACDRQGVLFNFGGPLCNITVGDASIAVTWGSETYCASHLIVATGAATPDVLRSHFPAWTIPLQPIRKVVAWYKPASSPSRLQQNHEYLAPDFPGFCVETPSAWYYGFPDFGEGVKVGRHDGGVPCTFDSVDRTFQPAGPDEDDLRAFLTQFLPRSAGSLTGGAVCMYTMTPDEHFVIDEHPQYKNVWVAAGFSGHGFKFASAVGEALAEQVTTGTSAIDLSLFRSNRF